MSLETFLQRRLDDYLTDLRILVSIDSGSEHKAGVDAINDWLAARLTALGCTVERHPQPNLGDNLLATLRGHGRGRIMLLGHSDTVYPVGIAAQRPMTIQEDKILGPGTCDMKAGLLSGLYALEALQHIDFADFEAIHYLCVSDEESHPRPSIPLIRETARQADAVLTLEAARANGDVVTARKGVRWYTLEAFGQAAHAGVEPEKGRSATLALVKQLAELDQFNSWRDGVTVNIGVIEGGTLPNVVANYAKARLDLRAWTDEEMEQLAQIIERQFAASPLPGVSLKMTVEDGSVTPAMPYTPAVAQLELLAREAAQSLDFDLRGARTGGSSDAAFAAAEGIPVLDGLGPIGGLDHSPNEYIELSSIVPRTALLAKLMMLSSKNRG
jgi:glutamate carboxypeptidase